MDDSTKRPEIPQPIRRPTPDEVAQKERDRGSIDTAGASAYRENARSALLSRAGRLQAEAKGLIELARSIPENFPLEADEALWRLAISSSR